MNEFNNDRLMDALIVAQNRTAVATLAAAIVQVRNAADVAAIMEAVSDAERIINPDYNTEVEWRKHHDLDPS